MKKIIKSALIIAGIMSCLSCAAYNVSAASVDDVIAHARQVGMPEEQVQNYISMGSGREWTSEQCDRAIAKLDEMYGTIDDKLINQDPENPDEIIENPMTPDEFKDLEIEDKKDYISKLPSNKKPAYLGVMTSGEKNQLIKDLDTNEQVEIISGMLGFGEEFGYSFSIEDVSDGAIMISARDENNKLVGVTVLGDTIEKTGIAYTIPVISAVILILLSAFGMVIAVRKCGDKK